MAKRTRRGGNADEYDDEPLDVVDEADDERERDRRDRDNKKGSKDQSPVKERTATATAPRFGFGRVGRFVREVVAELRKVIWPTRKELVTYAVVVVFFIAVMMAIIAGFDTGFGYLVRWVFGN